MKINIINKSNYSLPAYQTDLSAGMDLRADFTRNDSPEFTKYLNAHGNLVLRPMQRILVKTGLFLELPAGFEAQIRPRSGLAYKFGITVLNSPGTIDADYRGEVGVLLINLSEEVYIMTNGERIAQMVIAQHEHIQWQPAEILSETERGAGGYGSTGKE